MWGLAVLGGLLVALAAVDVGQTVLHPAGRGPVTLGTTTSVWYATRAVARVLGRQGVLMAAGPLAVLTVLVTWVALLWLGFALLYFAFLDRVAFAAAVSYADPGFLDALYLSGSALTTVGFGDVVGATDALRLLTALEAAAGFGLFTAAVTYLLSLYPLVTQLRSAARSLEGPAGDPARAAEVVCAGGAAYVYDLEQRLIALDEDTHRFPLLHYFHPRDEAASLLCLVRGATMVCLQARWGLADDAAGGARAFGEQLQRTLERTTENYARRIGFGGGTGELDRDLDADDARARLARLVDAAGSRGRSAPLDGEELGQFAAFVGRTEAFLEHLADRHLYRTGRLLG